MHTDDHSEFMEGGDLRSFLFSTSPFEPNWKLKIVKDVAAGMLHLALEGIIHVIHSFMQFTSDSLHVQRDLAARNILLTKTLDAKVSDCECFLFIDVVFTRMQLD
jgi:serine/threonine protein kinase